MTPDEAAQIVRAVLRDIAPEADPDAVPAGQTLQEGLDLDSIDFLDLVVGLHQRTGLDIPERDYPELATLDGCAAYLAARTAGAVRSGETGP